MSSVIDISQFRKPNNPVSLHAIGTVAPSTIPSANSGGTQGILPAERARATFEVEKMTNLLDGGVKATARRRFIISPTEGKDVSDKYFWDRKTLLDQHVKFFLDAHEEFMGKIIPTHEDGSYMADNSMLSGSFINHYGLFLPSLLGQASAEQQSIWIPKALTFQMVGVYAQTELGHGSNVRGLNTIATFDKATQEFVLNTPTLPSIKWWISGLGKVATHALVYAQLVLDGVEYGIHSFMVQLRDENHRPLPGIEVGDVGPKLGDNANDTGFLRLVNVRIPRSNMLSRWQEVSPEGVYLKSERKTNPRVHYATMVFARAGMIRSSGGHLARAVTIAIRYSCVRHQGFIQTKNTPSYKSEERKILDYGVQRYRLFKQLATAYAIKFIGGWMMTKFRDLEGLDNLEALPEIASSAAGLKGLCTFLAAQGIEDCRKSCGGHGYLLSSGVAQQGADYVWQTTAEGDYIVMLLQCARFLVKEVKAAREGKPTPGPCGYLSVLHQKNPNEEFSFARFAPTPATRWEEFLDPATLVRVYEFRALVAVTTAGDEVFELIREGKSFDDAWNTCATELANACRAHCFAFLLSTFHQQAAQVEDPRCREVATQLCAFFGISNILDDSWDGLVDNHQMQLMRIASRHLLDLLRPNAVALVDAFDIPDRVLQSTLGRYDGNVYEALFESALKSDLNQSDPFGGIDSLRKFLDLEDLKTGNKIDSKL